MQRMALSTSSSENEEAKMGGLSAIPIHNGQRINLELPQTNPFSKGRLLGAKNYVAAENFVIIEAIARRKAHYSWRDDNIWRAVAAEVSNSTAHDRTPAQISDHFKKMVMAVRSAITELFVNTKLTWPTRGSVEDEETLHAERMIYVNHLLSLMTGRGTSVKKYFSSNWWSDVVLLRLVELINSDEGRDYGNGNDMGEDFGDMSDRRHMNQSMALRAHQGSKRKRDDMGDQDMRMQGMIGDRLRSEVLDEALSQLQYVKHVAENVAQSLNTTNSNQKILESRVKDLEASNEELKHELHRMQELLKNVISQKLDELAMPL